ATEKLTTEGSGWKRLRSGPELTWHDHRLAPPRGLASTAAWTLLLSVGELRGVFVRARRPSPWPWLAGGLGALAAVAAAAHCAPRRRRRRAGRGGGGRGGGAVAPAAGAAAGARAPRSRRGPRSPGEGRGAAWPRPRWRGAWGCGGGRCGAGRRGAGWRSSPRLIAAA